MTKILIVTGNDFKFAIGKANLHHFNLEAEQATLEIDEIQGEDPDVIIRAKAAAAFAALQRPVLVTDDSWNFSGLRGFPGAYMKSINYWFTPDDFIRLTRDLEDRLVTLEQRVAYQDEHECVVFHKDLTGTLLTESRGEYGAPLMKVVAIDGDDGLSISEMHDAGKTHDEKRISRGSAWFKFAEWYQQSHQAN